MRNALLSFLIFFAVAGFESAAYEDRNYLTELYASTGNVFLMGGRGLPYPEYADRKAWQAISAGVAEEIIKRGETYLGYQWKTIPLTAYLAFGRSGDRNAMEAPYDSNRRALNELIIAELVEGKGRFIDQIANGVWMSCMMPSWVLSAHLVRQPSGRPVPDLAGKQIIDLGSAAYGATLSLAWHFFKDEFARLDPSINYALETAVREKILEPYLDPALADAHWWKAENPGAATMINNWNPWCNSNVLLCFLIMENDAGRFEKALETILASLDAYLNYVNADGACEEGPAYWNVAAAKVYDCLQLLSYASQGRFSIMDKPLIKAMGEFVAASYIADGYVANFADSPARLDFDPTLVYRYGKAVGSRKLTDFACYLTFCRSEGLFRRPKMYGGDDTFRSLESLSCLPGFMSEIDSLNQTMKLTGTRTMTMTGTGKVNVTESEDVNLTGTEDGIEAVVGTLLDKSNRWYEESQLAFFRNSNDWFVAVKGGHNGESHNHNDVGSFILFIGDVPVFVDAGVGSYTKQTFDHGRYGIWTMQSDWHNLPLINGTSQIYGREFGATDVSCDLSRRCFKADISQAYTKAASCKTWRRTCRLNEESLEIVDDYELTDRFLPDSLNFMVQGEVFMSGESVPDGRRVPKQSIVVCNKGLNVQVTYPHALAPSVTEMVLEDSKMSGIWGNSIRRISFTGDLPLKSVLKFKIKVF